MIAMIDRIRCATWRGIVVVAMLGDLPTAARGQEEPSAADDAPAPPSAADVTGDNSRWEYYQQIELPQDPPAVEYYDFIVPPTVFAAARYEFDRMSLYLGDLRLIDAEGSEVPYALRVRRPAGSKQAVPASEFNRAIAPDGASQLTLDLGAEPPEHNEVAVTLPGTDYRRRAVLEASDDNQQWQRLLESQLLYFRDDDKKFDRRTLLNPPSRFRYLRLSVYPDPEVDKMPVALERVEVRRTVTVPGELVTLPLRLEPREPTRSAGNPASAWILDLGVAHAPCEKLLVEVVDADFARDFVLEAGGQPESDLRFSWVATGSWTRRAGERRRPMAIDFDQRAPGRLRLIVTDYRNPPLDVRSAEYSAPARQIVFARKDDLRTPLRLYYGNPKADPPHYDLERNLPAQLEPAPFRLTLGERQENPKFVPEPKPLTERWPWLIYAVLGTVSVVLAGVLVNLGRAAVVRHDEIAGCGEERIETRH